MKQRWFIAVATSNGVDIAEQLGSARAFAIYEMSHGGEVKLVEQRTLGEKEHLPFYSPARLSPFFDGIDLLIVAELGAGAFQTLVKCGTQVLRLQGRIDFALECMARSCTALSGIREQSSPRTDSEHGHKSAHNRVNARELDWTVMGIFGRITRGLA